jgi:hypothetical protein
MSRPAWAKSKALSPKQKGLEVWLKWQSTCLASSIALSSNPTTTKNYEFLNKEA